MEEIWKDIKDFEGYYQVSNLGRIRSLDRVVNTWNAYKTLKGKICNLEKAHNGYLRIELNKNNKSKIIYATN